MNKKIWIILIYAVFFVMSCKEKKQMNEIEYNDRLISLVPSITDFICEVSPDKLVGISNACDASCVSNKMPVVGGYGFIDYEKIMDIDPTLVYVLNGFTSSEQIKRLNEFEIPIRSLNQNTILDILLIPQQIDSIKGKLMSDSLIKCYNQLKEIKVDDSPSYLIMISDDPIQVFGIDNYLSDFYNSLGFTNNINRKGYPLIQSEFFVNNLPDVIVSADKRKTKAVLESKFNGLLSDVDFSKILFIEMTENQISRPGPTVLDNGKSLLNKWQKRVE